MSVHGLAPGVAPTLGGHGAAYSQRCHSGKPRPLRVQGILSSHLSGQLFVQRAAGGVDHGFWDRGRRPRKQ
ncbi:hypothetical protein VULLAG_LOCUS3182 [Vulpes lagopus]